MEEVYPLNQTFNNFRMNYHSLLSSYISCSVNCEIHFLAMQIIPELQLFPFLTWQSLRWILFLKYPFWKTVYADENLKQNYPNHEKTFWNYARGKTVLRIKLCTVSNSVNEFYFMKVLQREKTIKKHEWYYPRYIMEFLCLKLESWG